jgi:hypothetical protein
VTDDAGVDFAKKWIHAWNERDVEAILAAFRDDVLFSSPLAARIIDSSAGVIRGKDALRHYWTRALRAHPELHFELLDVYVGVDMLVIRFLTEEGIERCEVLLFEGDLVRFGHGTYAAPWRS